MHLGGVEGAVVDAEVVEGAVPGFVGDEVGASAEGGGLGVDGELDVFLVGELAVDV